MKNEKTKTLKIEGKVSTPVEMTEETFTDMFLTWLGLNHVIFQGCVEDTSKSK
jgi:hypothetical protein